MKFIKFLRESFSTNERFLQEINIKYSYQSDTVESIDFRVNKRNIKDFSEAMKNFENSLVNEFRDLKNQPISVNLFLENISELDKIVFTIIGHLKSYYDLVKDYSNTSIQVHIVNFDFTITILIQGFYNFSNKNLSFSTQLENEVLDHENELLQEKLESIREEVCELIGVDPKLSNEGHLENYVFNLDINSDNQKGFLLQATEL